MSIWHYSACGHTRDSDYQELDPDGEWCDQCIEKTPDSELPERLRQAPPQSTQTPLKDNP
jgi:hypothetical protein